MRKILLFLTILISNNLFGQTTDVILKANHLGADWKFEEAINLLKSEIKINPDNSELYYWLGRYSHYIVYDSRPYSKTSDEWSKEEVLKNLKKAVELNPKYGDAKYFLAAEYGARGLDALKQSDAEKYKQELISAQNCGGFPIHAIEQGKNILKSCDTNAILLVDGDAHFNVIQYIQTVEGFRKDVSLIGQSLLERSFYIKLLRDGVKNCLVSVPLSCNDNLIMEMRDYKWRENIVLIPVSEKARKLNGFSDSIVNFNWNVKPDVCDKSLSPGMAMLVNIFETNQWERPIQTMLFGFGDVSGFEDNMQIVGMTARFLPYKVKGTMNEYDTKRFESLMLDPNNYNDYSDITLNAQPRTSSNFGNMSRVRILDYVRYLINVGNNEKAKLVLQKMNELMPASVFEPYLELAEDIRKLTEQVMMK